MAKCDQRNSGGESSSNESEAPDEEEDSDSDEDVSLDDLRSEDSDS